MDPLKKLGYPNPIPPVLYSFARFHGYAPPHFDQTFSHLVNSIADEKGIGTDDAKGHVLNIIQQDFDEWFYEAFGPAKHLR